MLNIQSFFPSVNPLFLIISQNHSKYLILLPFYANMVGIFVF